MRADDMKRACCRKPGPLANGSLTRSNGCLTGREHAFGPIFMRVLTGLTAPAPRGGPSRLWATRPREETFGRHISPKIRGFHCGDPRIPSPKCQLTRGGKVG